MATVVAYYTTSDKYPATFKNVYHDQDDCHYGKAIKIEHRATGTGGKPRCDVCKYLKPPTLRSGP
jgi:hypothetical protein